MFGRAFNKKEQASDSTTGVSSNKQLSPSGKPQFRSTAMIGQSIHIKGTISGAENLTIEGTVEGSIHLPDTDLTVGEAGQITADIAAKNVRVDGKVTGDIKGTAKVVISKTGRVLGNVVAPRVTLEDGAKFKGSIDMDPGENNETVARVEPKAAAPTREAKQEAS
ncbi:MAG: polymer-forming cytoskeletal protein [Pseudomonadota bacterium]|nr:polymer-forming cytoskeletal protein [Pseudomonadota bacterium]